MTIIYFIIISLTIFYSFQYDGKNGYDQHKSHRFWLVCVLLICVTGFSYGLGGDKFVYMREFEGYPSRLSELSETIYYKILFSGQMPLWTIVNFFAKYIFDSFYVVQLLEAASINVAAFYLCKQLTDRYFLFVLVYCFTFTYFMLNTDIMREGFAISLSLVGVEAYFRNKKVLALLCLIIASLFHISAAIMLIFPFVRSLKVSFKTLEIAFFFSLAVWVISDLLLSKVMISLLGGVGVLVTKILFYSSQATNFLGFLRNALTYMICPYIIMYYSTKWETSSERRRRKEKLLSFLLIIAMLAISLSGFTRLFNYALIFYLIIFADFLYALFERRQHLISRFGVALVGYILIVFPYLTVYWPITKLHYYNLWFPYTCIINEDKAVFIREEAQREALKVEKTDENTRDIE